MCSDDRDMMHSCVLRPPNPTVPDPPGCSFNLAGGGRVEEKHTWHHSKATRSCQERGLHKKTLIQDALLPNQLSQSTLSPFDLPSTSRMKSKMSTSSIAVRRFLFLFIALAFLSCTVGTPTRTQSVKRGLDGQKAPPRLRLQITDPNIAKAVDIKNKQHDIILVKSGSSERTYVSKLELSDKKIKQLTIVFEEMKAFMKDFSAAYVWLSI